MVIWYLIVVTSSNFQVYEACMGVKVCLKLSSQNRTSFAIFKIIEHQNDKWIYTDPKMFFLEVIFTFFPHSIVQLIKMNKIVQDGCRGSSANAPLAERYLRNGFRKQSRIEGIARQQVGQGEAAVRKSISRACKKTYPAPVLTRRQLNQTFQLQLL